MSRRAVREEERARRALERSGISDVIVAVIKEGTSAEDAAAQIARAQEMVGPEGTVMVVDFGQITQPPGPPTRRRPLPGEPDYIPPEKGH